MTKDDERRKTTNDDDSVLIVFEEEKLVVVSSNMWCTRFKLTGMALRLLPPYLGQVRYVFSCHKTAIIAVHE